MQDHTPKQKDFLNKSGVPETQIQQPIPDWQKPCKRRKLTIRDFMVLGGSMTEEEIDEYTKTHPEILE